MRCTYCCAKQYHDWPRASRVDPTFWKPAWKAGGAAEAFYKSHASIPFVPLPSLPPIQTPSQLGPTAYRILAYTSPRLGNYSHGTRQPKRQGQGEEPEGSSGSSKIAPRDPYQDLGTDSGQKNKNTASGTEQQRNKEAAADIMRKKQEAGKSSITAL